MARTVAVGETGAVVHPPPSTKEGVEETEVNKTADRNVEGAATTMAVTPDVQHKDKHAEAVGKEITSRKCAVPDYMRWKKKKKIACFC